MVRDLAGIGRAALSRERRRDRGETAVARDQLLFPGFRASLSASAP